MRKVFIYFALLSILFLGFILGTSNVNDDPRGSKKRTLSDKELKQKQLEASKRIAPGQLDINPISTSATILYVDSLNGANDITALEARGYGVFRRGGPAGTAPIWFQGNPDVFSALNGPDSGYVGSNFNSTTFINPIDNWLILPSVSTLAGDRLSFFSRSILGNLYPDSIKVMYSATGASTPEDPSWVELAYFFVNDVGVWENKDFAAPAAGGSARFAIRYFIINGGPSGDNSNYIGIDMITIYRPNNIDVGTISNNEPTGSITVPGPTIAPKATFKNFGLTTQNNIPVTYSITGPSSYTSNTTITTLAPSATQQVIFDSIFSPIFNGTYNVTIYTSLAVDDDRSNDTLRSSFTVVNANFGSGGTYFYANSTSGAATAPSQPQYCWKDTSGSRSLVVNNVNTAGAILTGSLDDGYFALGNILPPGKKLRFMGVDYDSVFIGTNGIIAFKRFEPGNSNWNPPSGGIPGGTVRPAFYPLWNDMDYSDTSVSNNRLSYKVVNGFQLIITYDRAPMFGADPTDYLSMQIVIDIEESLSATNSRLLVQYSLAGTGAGVISDYNANTFHIHLAGLQDATGTSALMYRFRNFSTVIEPGPIFDASPVAVQFGPDATLLNNRCGTGFLFLKVCLEAISPIPDSVYVSLRTPGSFEVVDAGKALLNASGIGTYPFSKIVDGQSYYLAVEHRNSLRTWSSVTISFTGGVVGYDFTLGRTQAAGSNMTLNSCFYTGDVNQDGSIDVIDLAAVYNKAQSTGGGSVGYIPEDLNYDDVVDVFDIGYVYNNVQLGIFEITP